MVQREIMQGAYCGDSDGWCAFEASKCTNPDTFLSVRNMQTYHHGRSCLPQAAVKSMPLGRCGDGNCAPNEASCASMVGFVDSDPTNPWAPGTPNVCDTEKTVYGRCGDRCSWSPDDCAAGEEWTFPSQGCSCEHVQVGACEKDGIAFCAPSPNSCDAVDTWMGPLALTSAMDLECFLCRATPAGLDFDESPQDSSDPVPDDIPVIPDPSSDSLDEVLGTPDKLGSLEEPSGSDDSSSDVGLIVGATLGAVFGGFLIVLFLAFYAKKRQASTTASQKREVVTPPHSITASAPEDVEELEMEDNHDMA